jgi:iron(III) transport system substrate-binding protein
LTSYSNDSSNNYPDQFVSQNEDWFGFAARARVFLVNTDLLPDKSKWPKSVKDLADPAWKGQGGIAKPLFGTTASHAAVLYTKLGGEKANEFFRAVADHSNVESGNKQVAINVARGVYAFGLTDTDDAIIEIEAGHRVAMIFPDQGDGQDGTLLIPNTLCITGGPNTENARKLIDFLLQQKIEERLAEGRSAQIPLHKSSEKRSRVEPDEMKVMSVDFEAAEENWDDVKKQLVEIFPL